MTDITVIVPTLNEAGNIDVLLERVLPVCNGLEQTFDVLFVDSASQDGTGERVLSWRDRGPVRLLQHDRDVGLAGAVISGARISHAPLVVIMDADLSHPPEVIPFLLEPLIIGTHDMAIGSRYTAGGTTIDWSLARRFVSRVATMPALLFCTVKDPLAGFFAIERWRIVELRGSVPGFKIGLALLTEYGSDMRVKEVPIAFRDRYHGESKMSGRIMFAYLRQLAMIVQKRIGKRHY